MAGTLSTPITELFGIQHPVMLAGMSGISGPELAAAVTNAGGIGTIGGVTMTPDALRKSIAMLKAELTDKTAAFGVDLLLPQVGGSARKTNYDYTHGDLGELVDVIIEGGAKLFVVAVGTAPKWVVDKFHAHGILVMNMVGAVKHVNKALETGVDLICAQGGEGGGHTGDIPSSVLVPKIVDACRGRLSPLTGKQVPVVAAGGIYDGRGLAMALAAGAAGVWVGTRFVACEEAAAGPHHKKLLCGAGYSDTVRTLIYSGRPMRLVRTAFVDSWEQRPEEIQRLLEQGKIPVDHEEVRALDRPFLMGQAAGAIDDVLPAKTIVEEMVAQAYEHLTAASHMCSPAARL